MRDFMRLFELERVFEGWPDDAVRTVTTFTLSVKNDILLLRVRSGRGLTVESFIAAFLRLMKAYEAAHGPINHPRRSYPVRFLVEYDKEERVTLSIEEEVDKGYPTKKTFLDIGPMGSVHVGYISVYDALDFLVADSRVALTQVGQEQHYQFHSDNDGFDSMVMVEPRDISLEPGWIQPDEVPQVVIDD